MATFGKTVVVLAFMALFANTLLPAMARPMSAQDYMKCSNCRSIGEPHCGNDHQQNAAAHECGTYAGRPLLRLAIDTY